VDFTTLGNDFFPCKEKKGDRMSGQKVYVLRVDGFGRQYAGYITEWTEELYTDLLIDREWMEQIEVTEEFSIVCNKEGAVMGLPLNRALFDEKGCLITVIGGNLFIIKRHAGTASDITSDDVALLESRLKAILMISHGLVFTKEESELSEWIKKD
jgi:hypothetical protein